MPSDYPSKIDTFVNPSPGDPQSAPSHAAQHVKANDAIKATQQALGTNPQGSHPTVAARLNEIPETAADVGAVPGFEISSTHAMHIGEYDPNDPPTPMPGSISIGHGAAADGLNVVVLGTGSVATRDNLVSVGSPSNLRRIVHVAEGTAPSDAATVGQLPTEPSDIGAIPDPSSRAMGDVLTWDGDKWVADEPGGGGGGGGVPTTAYPPGMWHRTVGERTEAVLNPNRRYIPVAIEETILVDRVGLDVTSAGDEESFARIGFYKWNHAALEWQLILDVAPVPTNATGAVSAALNPPETLPAGAYLTTVVSKGSSNATVRGIARASLNIGGSTLGGRSLEEAGGSTPRFMGNGSFDATNPLPGSLGALGVQAGEGPVVFWRVAD